MDRRGRVMRVLRPILLIAVMLVVARIVIGLLGSVDWSEVWSALRRVPLAAVPLLIALLLVRQAFNAVPLTRFVGGLSWWRSAQNDVTANLVGTVAPPPGDVVIRVSMFRSWGLNPVDGMAGVTLNSLTFYVIRFAVPSLGLLLLIPHEFAAGWTWLALGSLLIAAVIVVALILVSRGERLAAMTGRVAARVVARVKEGVDPEAWASAVLDFRQRMSSRLTRGLAPALIALLAMVLADGLVLLVALRAVGVPAEVLAVTLVLGCFLVAYPLTAMPLAGLGLLDATLIVAFSEIAGSDYESEIIAGFVVWRVVTILGPLLLGLIAFGAWRMRARQATDAPAPPPAAAGDR